MQAGDMVWVSFVSGDHTAAFVTQYEVLDAEHRIVKRLATGEVRLLIDFETVHDSEAAAWEQAAREILDYAAKLRAEADECLKRAARASVVQVPA